MEAKYYQMMFERSAFHDWTHEGRELALGHMH
jgi:hypothetical protein